MMELFVPFCFLAISAVMPTDAVPLASRVRQEARDTFIIMPGLNRRSFFIEEATKSTDESAADPPLLFGESFNVDSTAPISFGDGGNQALPVPVEDKTELLPVVHQQGSEIKSSSDEGSGVLNVVHFPTAARPVADPASNADPFTEDEGSGGSVHFPTQIKVNIRSEENSTTITTVEGGAQCGPALGSVVVNGTCQTFLGRNACRNNEWYVMTDVNNEGECAPLPCPRGELMYRGTCVNAIDEGVCNEGQMLYIDFTGSVHCDCRPNFIYDPWSGKCYAQGDQGNCNFGEYLYVDDAGLVQCKANPCLMAGFVFHNETRRCYRKEYRGFCQDGLLITHASNLTAECGAINEHSIFDLPTMRSCGGGSLRDYAGNCRREFRVPSVSSAPALYGGCPGSFIKVAGSCRRAHKLIG